MLANVLQPLIGLEEWVLEALHGVGLGWGLAIVVLTLLVRAAILPLTIRQLRAQHELRRHLPELRRLRERYGDDPERLRKQTLAYYAEHGINPLAQFVPVLLQIPIFISLYYVMRTDVASGLFGDAGFLFIPDLAERPHGAVLVALLLTYTLSQLAAAAVAGRALAGRQRRLTLALPVLFAGVASRFPAGLLVYWITTSLWTLGQHVAVWRVGPPAVPEPAPPAPATRTRPHPVSKKRRRKRKRRR